MQMLNIPGLGQGILRFSSTEIGISRYTGKLSKLNTRKCSRDKVHRVEESTFLLKNKAQRNVIREKHFENYKPFDDRNVTLM